MEFRLVIVLFMCLISMCCAGDLGSIGSKSSDFFFTLIRGILSGSSSYFAPQKNILRPIITKVPVLPPPTEYSIIKLSESYPSHNDFPVLQEYSIPSREPYHEVQVPKEFSPGWEPGRSVTSQRVRRPGRNRQIHRQVETETIEHRHEENERSESNTPAPFVVRVLSATPTKVPKSQVRGTAASLEDSWPSVWKGTHK